MTAAPSERLLIVDDEPVLMTALCNTLADFGYRTVGCTSGAAALEALRGERFDLLVADLMMPGMDGIGLLRAAVEIDPELVGIIMTGQGTIDSAVAAMKAGALDYILKPFQLRIILPVLARACEVRRLRSRNAELQRDVRRRTQELEALNHELEAFSYSVSHDLRAPLRSIHGFTSILLDEFSPGMPAEAGDLLGRILGSTNRLVQLIDDLMRLSQLTRQPLAVQAVSVATMVREVLDDLLAEEASAGARVQTGELPDCVGDPPLVRQVFVNLLSNAFKFTRHRADRVIEIGSHEEAGERAYFVRDNGAGFDMQYADKLFGVFQRLHRPDEFEGTGVGLSIVERIVRRHGGRIWAEAEPDRGATFYFTLAGHEPVA